MTRHMDSLILDQIVTTVPVSQATAQQTRSETHALPPPPQECGSHAGQSPPNPLRAGGGDARNLGGVCVVCVEGGHTPKEVFFVSGDN